MKLTISWNNSGYVIDGKPAPLISGEFHYFRVPHDDWRRRLTLLKESGANTVATYIPWIIHEPEEAICYVINLLCGKQTANIKIKANGKLHDLGELEVPPMTVMPIDL